MGGGASIGAPVVVSSPHRGDLLSVGGRVTVDSRVDGDLWVVGADAELSPSAEVTGNVVVIGGRLNASPRAVVGGTVSQLPGLKVPLLGVLGTQFSAQALELAGVVLGYVLLGSALFLSSIYLAAHARGCSRPCRRSGGKPSSPLLSPSCVIPLAVVLIIASVVGVFLLPLLVLVVFLLALDGYLALCTATVAGSAHQGAAESRKRRVALPFYLWSARAVPGERARACRYPPHRLSIRRACEGRTAAPGADPCPHWRGLAYGFGATLAHTRYAGDSGRSSPLLPWQYLYFFPDPQGQGRFFPPWARCA